MDFPFGIPKRNGKPHFCIKFETGFGGKQRKKGGKEGGRKREKKGK